MDSTLVNSATGSGVESDIFEMRMLLTFVRVNGQSFTRGGEVVGIDVESGEAGDFHTLSRERRGPDAGEGIEKVLRFLLAVNADALLDEGDGESGRVRAFLVL